MITKELLITYRNYADELDFDWKEIDSKELVIKAQNNINNQVEYNRLFSAIVCRFFSRITYMYRQYSKSNHLSIQEIQDLYIDSILSLVKQNYTDEYIYKNDIIVKNPLYADNGVKIALLTIIKTKTLIYIKSKKCDVRYANYNINNISLDDKDDCDIEFSNRFGKNNLIDDLKDNLIQDLIIKTFNEYNYQLFFILDGIINTNCFSDKDNKFKIYTLANHLISIDNDYLKTIADIYRIDFNKLSIAYDCTNFKDMNQDQARWKILSYIKLIKKNFNKD